MSEEAEDENGEPPSKVLFEKHQRQVTDYGIESVHRNAPYYHFNAERLLEIQGAGEGKLYDWPVHMAEKTWVDIDAFIEAFKEGLKLHSAKLGTVDQKVLEASFAKARQIARGRG
jgi:hypothetical protein